MGGPALALLIFQGIKSRRIYQQLSNCLATRTSYGWRRAIRNKFNDAVTRRLIRDYCFDYVTLPTSNERIVDAVGHAHG
ncbi:VpsR-related response regulator, partial [Caballeronia choica]|uniref:VpsR-related response regulator n=1 Tax=Caballeronia choica TaxID=326476 RepID=UPI002E14B854